jgi:hypothetical protein
MRSTYVPYLRAQAGTDSGRFPVSRMDVAVPGLNRRSKMREMLRLCLGFLGTMRSYLPILAVQIAGLVSTPGSELEAPQSVCATEGTSTVFMPANWRCADAATIAQQYAHVSTRNTMPALESSCKRK